MKGTNKISIESKKYLKILQNLVLIKKKGLTRVHHHISTSCWSHTNKYQEKNSRMLTN